MDNKIVTVLEELLHEYPIKHGQHPSEWEYHIPHEVAEEKAKIVGEYTIEDVQGLIDYLPMIWDKVSNEKKNHNYNNNYYSSIHYFKGLTGKYVNSLIKNLIKSDEDVLTLNLKDVELYNIGHNWSKGIMNLIGNKLMGVGNNMKGGKINVFGNDALVGFLMKGGEANVYGSAETHSGMSMENSKLNIFGDCSWAGLYMKNSDLTLLGKGYLPGHKHENSKVKEFGVEGLKNASFEELYYILKEKGDDKHAETLKSVILEPNLEE
jgi:formylmethanofuran dehydrogenase subunit C